MCDFQIGDRVKCISPEADSDCVFGDTGTVWALDEGTFVEENRRVGVEWDNFSDGHDIDYKNPCRTDHGWWVYCRTLQLIMPEPPEVEIDFEMRDIL